MRINQSESMGELHDSEGIADMHAQGAAANIMGLFYYDENNTTNYFDHSGRVIRREHRVIVNRLSVEGEVTPEVNVEITEFHYDDRGQRIKSVQVNEDYFQIGRP